MRFWVAACQRAGEASPPALCIIRAARGLGASLGHVPLGLLGPGWRLAGRPAVAVSGPGGKQKRAKRDRRRELWSFCVLTCGLLCCIPQSGRLAATEKAGWLPSCTAAGRCMLSQAVAGDLEAEPWRRRSSSAIARLAPCCTCMGIGRGGYAGLEVLSGGGQLA
jgi:hypothetical protein